MPSRWPIPKHHKPKDVNEYPRKGFYRIGHSTEPVIERLRKEHQQFDMFGFGWSLKEQWERANEAKKR